MYYSAPVVVKCKLVVVHFSGWRGRAILNVYMNDSRESKLPSSTSASALSIVLDTRDGLQMTLEREREVFVGIFPCKERAAALEVP